MGRNGDRTALGRRSGALSDSICAGIRERVFLGEFRANDILVESRLAEGYGVSRTPIREALSVLSREGLVEVIPRVGYRVVPIALRDVHEIYDLRILIEGEACALAALKATEQAVAGLREKHKAWAEKADSDLDPLEYLRFHDAFHLGITELSENHRLAQYVTQLLRDGTRVRMSDPLMTVSGLEEEEADCDALCVALSDRDPKRARLLMQNHIAESKKRVLHSLIHSSSSTRVEI